MAHYFESGFMGENKSAWHGLGTVIEGNATPAEAMELAGLDWRVGKQPVLFNGQPYANKFFTVRIDGPQPEQSTPLGIVTDQYKVFQNEEMFELVDLILDEDTSQRSFVHTAGVLKGSTQVWALLKLGEFMPLGQVSERIEEYMLVTTSHDGSMPVTVAMTNERVECSNTQALALKTAQRIFKVRHSQTMDGKLQDARTALGTARLYNRELKSMAENLMVEPFSKHDMQRMCTELFPISESASEAQTTRRQNQRAQLYGLWKASDNLDNVRYTKWGGLQAVIEYSDHHGTRRETSGSSKAENRMISIVEGAPLVKRAQELVLS